MPDDEPVITHTFFVTLNPRKLTQARRAAAVALPIVARSRARVHEIDCTKRSAAHWPLGLWPHIAGFAAGKKE